MATALKTLKPHGIAETHYAPLEDHINKVLWEKVFGPVVALLKKHLPRAGKKALPELKNAPEDVLREALRTGNVQMATDAKSGKAVFTVVGGQSNQKLADSLRSFGASFNRVISAYTCDIAQVPSWVRNAAESYSTQARDAHARLLVLLKDLERSSATGGFDLVDSTRQVVASTEDSWKSAARVLEVKPDLGPEGRTVLAEEMAKSAAIPVKDFIQEMLGELRTEVEANAERGYRMEGLAKRVAERFGVSQSRANLIAYQETNNFMSNYEMARSLDAGLPRYVWLCSMDGRERPDHRKLHGTTQRWDSPPIVCQRTGKQGHPGQDFRCRCVAASVIE
jgi:SPP1 gp7 family putative phage head morphogenesis protein